jgi:hypothetical protein
VEESYLNDLSTKTNKNKMSLWLSRERKKDLWVHVEHGALTAVENPLLKGSMNSYPEKLPSTSQSDSFIFAGWALD